jgi:hypothetical protein
MSKSKTASAIVGSKKKDRGKRGRKVGKGVHKLSHSKWGNYAVLINHQFSRRLGRLARRYCKVCKVQFHSRGALKKHACENN